MNDSLQFDHAELASPSACGACKAELGQSYFQAAGQMLCGTCADEVRQSLAGAGTRGGRLMKAALFGVGAGILGALIYFAVLELTGYNVGLVAIVVGFLVGRAVRRGSGGRGGLGYQFLAAGITYLAISATYLPMALGEIGKELESANAEAVVSGSDKSDNATPNLEETKAPDAKTEAASVPAQASASPDPQPAEESGPLAMVIGLVALVALTLSLPVLIALEGGVLSLLIVGFGVWEAWRVNKRVALDITGPHSLAARPPSLPPADA